MAYKLPFVLSDDDFKFEPRHHRAQRQDLDPIDRDILDAMDVFEQRQDKLVEVAVFNRTLLILVTLAVLPAVYALVSKIVPHT